MFGCTGRAEGGSSEIHARVAVVVAWGDGPSEPDALKALADLKQGAPVTITGLEWAEVDGASYLISMSTSCADGVERTGPHFSLYQMGGDPRDLS
jgi:hypothetical protein